jgi:hypothetical protein
VHRRGAGRPWICQRSGQAVQRPLEVLEPLADRAEPIAEGDVLILEPAGAHPELQPTSAQAVDRGGGLRDELRRPEPRGQDEHTESHPRRPRRDRGERRERLERLDRRGVLAVASERVKEVIRQPHRVEPEVLGAACPTHRVVVPDPPGREREAVLREREPEAHRGEHTEPRSGSRQPAGGARSSTPVSTVRPRASVTTTRR